VWCPELNDALQVTESGFRLREALAPWRPWVVDG
jgi:hypothetical protein